MSKQSMALLLPTPQALAGMPADTPVLLAFSGGADSRALLHLLAEQAAREGFRLAAAHLHHGIRGEEADRDQAFCRVLAERYGIVLYERRVDVPELAHAEGRSLEDAAREARYAFLQNVMQEQKIPLLVTAHHADDQAETLLFRMCRGTGADGLRGIAQVRDLDKGYKLVRPLLEVTRREILKYCEEQGLEYVTDSTNADTAYARNRIRAEVIPVLEGLFEAPQRRIAALARELGEDSVYLLKASGEFLRKHDREGRLPTDALRSLPNPILRRVLAAWAAERGGISCERVHTEAMMALVRGGTPQAEVALPGERKAYCEGGFLCMMSSQCEGETLEYRIPFEAGEWCAPGTRLLVSTQKKDAVTKINNLDTQKHIILYINSVIMKGSLHWRTMKEGDVMLSRGMHKRLRRLYREAGIDARTRRKLPLLCDCEGILWAPYVGVRDGLPCAGECYEIEVKEV